MRTATVIDPASSRELRRSVLRPELPPDADLPGDEVPDAVHLGVADPDTPDGPVLSTCFVYPEPCPWRPDVRQAWHLRQMATDPGHRGQGLGAAVLVAAVAAVTERGADLLWCNARSGAVGFYARHGFVSHGDEFTDERHRIPHRRMARTIG